MNPVCQHGVAIGMWCNMCGGYAQAQIFNPPLGSGGFTVNAPSPPDYTYLLNRIALALEGLLAKENDRSTKEQKPNGVI